MTGIGARPDKCMLVFIKAPRKGAVKTRLAASIGDEHACGLYERFVPDLLKTLEKAADDGHCALNVCFHPPASASAVAAWLGGGYACFPQRGRTLGERMKNAFREGFAAGHRRILLLGSDIPDLPAQIIHDGFAALKKHGAVIGPSHDGGYYLIGFRADRFLPGVFAGVHWGTGEVFEETMARLRLGIGDVSILPVWRDIDTLGDLMDLQSRHRRGAFLKSATMRYLRAHDLTATRGDNS